MNSKTLKKHHYWMVPKQHPDIKKNLWKIKKKNKTEYASTIMRFHSAPRQCLWSCCCCFSSCGQKLIFMLGRKMWWGSVKKCKHTNTFNTQFPPWKLVKLSSFSFFNGSGKFWLTERKQMNLIGSCAGVS